MTDYTATDDDLPAIFWQKRKARKDVVGTMTQAERAAAVSLHYPAIKVSRRQQQRREAALRSEREVSLQDRKVFIKLSKKLQMWDWLCGLLEPDTIVKIQNRQELTFVTQLYAKFFRYQPNKLKWVTRKQYDWLKYIACQYLKVPHEQS